MNTESKIISRRSNDNFEAGEEYPVDIKPFFLGQKGTAIDKNGKKVIVDISNEDLEFYLNGAEKENPGCDHCFGNLPFVYAGEDNVLYLNNGKVSGYLGGTEYSSYLDACPKCGRKFKKTDFIE